MAKKTQKPEYLSFAVSQVGVFPKRPDMKSWKSKMQTSKIPREKSKNTKHNNIPDVLEVKIQNETIFELFLIFACLTAKTSGILFCFVFFVFFVSSRCSCFVRPGVSLLVRHSDHACLKHE